MYNQNTRIVYQGPHRRCFRQTICRIRRTQASTLAFPQRKYVDMYHRRADCRIFEMEKGGLCFLHDASADPTHRVPLDTDSQLCSYAVQNSIT